MAEVVLACSFASNILLHIVLMHGAVACTLAFFVAELSRAVGKAAAALRASKNTEVCSLQAISTLQTPALGGRGRGEGERVRAGAEKKRGCGRGGLIGSEEGGTLLFAERTGDQQGECLLHSGLNLIEQCALFCVQMSYDIVIT